MKNHIVSILALATAIAALAIAIHTNGKDDARTEYLRSGRRYSVTLENKSKTPAFVFVDADMPNRMLAVAPGAKASLDGVPYMARARTYVQAEGQMAPGVLKLQTEVTCATVLTIE